MGSSFAEFIVWVAPSAFAFCSFSSWISTAIISEAPNALAICKQLEPVIKLKRETSAFDLEPIALWHGQNMISNDSKFQSKWKYEIFL